MIGWLRKYQHVVRTIPDRLLLSRIKRGDREAYGKLYMKYIDQIYRYVFYRINQNTAEAEDITEAVFFKAYRTIKNFPLLQKNQLPFSRFAMDFWDLLCW